MGFVGAESRRLSVTIVGINYTPEPTGIAPYTAGLAGGLAARGHRVRVVTSYPHYPWWKVAADYTGWSRSETLEGVAVRRLRHYVPPEPTTKRRAAMETLFGARAVLSRWWHPDVVVVVSPALLASRLALSRARAQKIPVVTWMQDIYTLGLMQTGGDARQQRLVRAVESSLLARSTRVVVIHERFRQYLRSDLGVRTPIDVVRNWSHIEAAPPSGRTATRAQHGWDCDDIVVLHAGNMGAKQALENVVAASRLASQRGSRARFVLMGDGNQRKVLERLDPNPRLHFVDPLPDGLFEQALAAADILLVNEQAGLTEMSVPSKLTSYCATGRPVLAAVDAASTTAGELELSGAGIVVAAQDPEALLDAVERLAGLPDLATAMGEAGLRFREERLTLAAGIDRFEQILTEVVGP